MSAGGLGAALGLLPSLCFFILQEGASLNLLELASCCSLGMVVIRAAQMSQLVLSF